MKRALPALVLTVACRVDFDRELLVPPAPTIVETGAPDPCPPPTPARCSRSRFEAPALLLKNLTSNGGPPYAMGGASIRTYHGTNEIFVHFHAAYDTWRLASVPVNDAFVAARTSHYFFEDNLPVLQSAGINNRDPAFAASGTWVVWTTKVTKDDPSRLRFANFDEIVGDWMRPVALSTFDTIGKEQYGPSPSANGCRLFFSAGERDQTGDVYVATGVPGAWSSPRPIENPSDPASKYDDAEPTTSADGRTVIFASNREGKGSGNYDLWITEEESAPDAATSVFSAPQKLPADGVNTMENETSPHLSFDGCSLLFSRGNSEVWISRRKPDSP